MYQHQQAWESRGSKLANETSETQFDEMRRLALLSEKDVDVAERKIPSCVLCARTRNGLNRAQGRPRADSLHQLETAVRIDPNVPSPVFSFFTGLYPQWGGSFDEMHAFIERMRKMGVEPSIVAELESRYCWLQAHYVYYLQKDRKTMLEWYERGLTSHPYDLLLKNLAHTYAEQGQLMKSAQMLELNMRVNNPWDLYTIEALAITYFQLGLQEKGAAMMKKRDESQWRYANYM